jgi:hypothetical protein
LKQEPTEKRATDTVLPTSRTEANKDEGEANAQRNNTGAFRLFRLSRKAHGVGGRKNVSATECASHISLHLWFEQSLF